MHGSPKHDAEQREVQQSAHSYSIYKKCSSRQKWPIIREVMTVVTYRGRPWPEGAQGNFPGQWSVLYLNLGYGYMNITFCQNSLFYLGFVGFVYTYYITKKKQLENKKKYKRITWILPQTIKEMQN